MPSKEYTYGSFAGECEGSVATLQSPRWLAGMLLLASSGLRSIQMASIRAGGHPHDSGMVFALLAFVPRRGGAIGQAWALAGSRHRLEMGPAVRGCSGKNCQHRLNNVLEQDHRAIKRRVRASQHFRSLWGAWRTIAGYEEIHMIPQRPCVLQWGGCGGRSTAPLHSRSVRCDELNFRSFTPTFASLQHIPPGQLQNASLSLRSPTAVLGSTVTRIQATQAIFLKALLPKTNVTIGATEALTDFTVRVTHSQHAIAFIPTS